jgi:hypothetical protein
VCGGGGAGPEELSVVIFFKYTRTLTFETHDQVGCRKNGGRGGDGRNRRYFIDHVGGRQDWLGRAKTRMWWSAVSCGVVSGGSSKE